MSVSVMVAPPPDSSAVGTPTPATPASVRGDMAAVQPTQSMLADLLELTKPRIVSMILITTGIAALIAGGGVVAPWVLVHLIVGVAMVAGSAGAMNQVWEYRIDGEMERTRRRPIAAGRIGFWTGFLFSVVLGWAGCLYLWVALDAVPAWFALATWLLYVPIYTPMKVRSQWNTTIGAISGALPMMIGYTAAGGGASDPVGWLLVGVLMAWQYPHFMAIAWLFRRQYAQAGFQMTTTVEPTGRSAAIQSVLGMVALGGCLVGLVYSIAGTSPIGLALMTTLVLLVTYPMTAAAVRFWRSRDDDSARKLLRASLLQLPASLLLLTIAALVWGR